MRTRPRGSALLTLMVAGTVAACSSGAGTGAPATTAPATAASPSPTPAPVTASAGDPEPRQATPAPPRCTTGELSVSLGDGGAAAGSVYRPLIFVNVGRDLCELRGFPGVSYVAGDDGHQVGPAAEMSGERGGQIMIPPGRTAVAQLQLVNVQNFDAAACRPTPVRGLRVYPPGDTAALFVPIDGMGCAGTPPGPQLSVQTMRAP